MVTVEFLLSDDEMRSLLDRIEREKVWVFYAKFPAEFGMTEGTD
jgi:predicted cupin superfamily sugar epimerase